MSDLLSLSFDLNRAQKEGGLRGLSFNPEKPTTPVLEPFDPSKHTPQDVGKGGPSTEFLATEGSPDGVFWNIPIIWWDEKGNPVELELREAQKRAKEYEKTTGQRFPRYNTPQEGSDAARSRSEAGGASTTPLTSIKGTIK